MFLYCKNKDSLEIYEVIPNMEKINEFRKKQALKLDSNYDVFYALCCDEKCQVLNENEIVFYNTLIHPGKFDGCWHHDFKNYIPSEDEAEDIIDMLINQNIKEYREVKAVINGEVETIKYLLLLKPKYVEQVMEVYKMSMIIEVSKDFYILNKLLNSIDIFDIDITYITLDVLKFFNVKLKEITDLKENKYNINDKNVLKKSRILLKMFNMFC